MLGLAASVDKVLRAEQTGAARQSVKPGAELVESLGLAGCLALEATADGLAADCP